MTSAHEQLLIDLSHWLGRVLQYPASHPACVQMAEKTHASLRQALALGSPLAFGVLKDDVLIGEVPAKHPAIRGRLAPYLHERGVLVLRFVHGVTLEELTSFVVLLTVQTQTIFDRGGMIRLAHEAGILHVQIDEIAHDVTDEERESHRRRKKLREFFKDMLRNMLAHRAAGAIGEHMAELLEHPEVAVAILEEDGAGVAEAAAGLALMARQEELRSGVELGPKLRAVLLRLAPQSRDRMLLGLPSLMGEFRQALAWAIDGLTPNELAHLLFPSLRAHATDLDPVLYAAGAAVAHDGRRMSALRRAGLSLFDLQVEDAAAREVLAALARPVPEYDSYRRERECLHAAAERALAMCAPPPQATEREAPPFDGRRSVREVVAIATRTKGFDRLCRKFPEAARRFAASGTTDAALGLLTALSSVAQPEWTAVARQAARDVAVLSGAAVLAELDARSSTASPGELDETMAIVRILVTHAPAAVLDRLDVSDSRKMRRLMLDTLPSAGAALLPLLSPRLGSNSWFVVRNAVLLVARCGGASSDLAGVIRHPNERVRIEVLRALRATPPDSTTMDLAASCLLDASPEIRANAAALLQGELLGPGAIAELARVAAADAQPEATRLTLVAVLGRSSHDAAASALFEIMQPRGLIEMGGAASVRDAAAVALRRCPAPRAATLFGEGLNSPVKRVRRACERAQGMG